MKKLIAYAIVWPGGRPRIDVGGHSVGARYQIYPTRAEARKHTNDAHNVVPVTIVLKRPALSTGRL